jgi:hypothetical protein
MHHLNDHTSTYNGTGIAQYSDIAPDNIPMFHFPTSYIEVPQLQSVVGLHAHAWRRDLPQGLNGIESSSHTMSHVPYTNGGIPSSSGYETQFVSNPQPPVSYTGYWPVDGGYHIAPGHGGQYSSPFDMSVHPVVSQTPTVYHTAPNTCTPLFASAARPSSSETNAAPAVLGMFGVAGQGIALDATTPSTHPYPTGMPPFPTTLGGDPSATTTPNTVPVSNTTLPPVVRCMVDNCGQDIAVDKNVLREHLTTIHGYPAPHRSHSVICGWGVCLCTRPSTCRFPNLGVGHAFHTEDITEHVWAAHLNFQDVCWKCGDARWAKGFSLQRHVSGCGGRKQARCKGCCHMFRSTAALVGHVELGQCVGTVVV